MTKNVVILPDALDDTAEARDWYESRSIGLGDRFLDHVDECIDRVRKNRSFMSGFIKTIAAP